MGISTTANPDLRFGSDYSTFRPIVLPDGTRTLTYGLTYTRIYGPRVPLEGVVRRWLTGGGQMFWAPNAGFSVARLLNSGRDTRVLSHYAAMLMKEAQQVDFVSSANVVIRYVGTTLTIIGTIVLTTGGTYPLNVGITTTGQVLAQFPNT